MARGGPVLYRTAKGDFVPGSIVQQYSDVNGTVTSSDTLALRADIAIIGKDYSNKILYNVTKDNILASNNTFQFVSPLSTVKTITTSTTLLSDDTFVLVNANTSNIQCTLPSASSGRVITIKKIDSSSNSVTFSGSIDFLTTIELKVQNQSITLASDGSVWRMINGSPHALNHAPGGYDDLLLNPWMSPNMFETIPRKDAVSGNPSPANQQLSIGYFVPWKTMSVNKIYCASGTGSGAGNTVSMAAVLLSVSGSQVTAIAASTPLSSMSANSVFTFTLSNNTLIRGTTYAVGICIEESGTPTGALRGANISATALTGSLNVNVSLPRLSGRVSNVSIASLSTLNQSVSDNGFIPWIGLSS